MKKLTALLIASAFTVLLFTNTSGDLNLDFQTSTEINEDPVKNNAHYVAELSAAFIHSNKVYIEVCNQGLKNDIPNKIRTRLKDGIRQIKAINKSLNKLKAQSKKQGLSVNEIKVLLSKVINLQNKGRDIANEITSNSKLGGFQIIDGAGRPVIIIPIGPGNGSDCSNAGAAVKDDCMQALEILEDCEAISSSDKIMGQLQCDTAGSTEENACNLNNIMGQPHSPKDNNLANEAQAQCNYLNELNAEAAASKQTVDGN